MKILLFVAALLTLSISPLPAAETSTTVPVDFTNWLLPGETEESKAKECGPNQCSWTVGGDEQCHNRGSKIYTPTCVAVCVCSEEEECVWQVDCDKVEQPVEQQGLFKAKAAPRQVSCK